MITSEWKRWILASAVALLALAPIRASAQTTGGPFSFYPVVPCRLVDSRINQGATVLAGGVQQNVTVKGHCSVPSTAKVIFANVTVVNPTSDGFLTFWTAGTGWPGTSNINFRTVDTAQANTAVVPLSAGTPDLAVIYGSAVAGTTNFLVDVMGYYQ